MPLTRFPCKIETSIKLTINEKKRDDNELESLKIMQRGTERYLKEKENYPQGIVHLSSDNLII